MKRIPVDQGMLYYFIKKIHPALANRISEEGKIETMVVGLGGQGTKHAGIMRDFGTTITAGIAAGRGGGRIHEDIPVYNSIRECMNEHPYIAAASIWRHYSSAREAALEVIEAGIPLVVLISEGIPLRDLRDILTAARKRKTLLLGGNTPGVIFPPEGIKIGMLPDVFYPAETSPGVFGPKGVTIISRSGAILYHMSDGLASSGIAQNAVLGVGGDGAIGTTFRDLVPLVSGYEHTDLVVVAGEIGGCQEELFADHVKQNPDLYPKPIIALISGAHAPAGKTMGHAGAIVAPGQEYGTFSSKKKALEEAGIKVVNSQYDLIKEAKSILGEKTYFEVSRYYDHMGKQWDAPPPGPHWGTVITEIQPNAIRISGYDLSEIVERGTLLEAAYLLNAGELPPKENLEEYHRLAIEGVRMDPPPVKRREGEDLSKTLAKYLLMDDSIPSFSEKGPLGPVKKTVFTLGRMARYLGQIFGGDILPAEGETSFSSAIFTSLTGQREVDPKRARMVEAMIVASIDHGVTPPSAQATLIAASVRGAYEVALAQGVGAITDVHGGAGEKAAHFFSQCLEKAKKEGLGKREATKELMAHYILQGSRIEGLGHRVHTKDPRRNILWKRAEETGVAGGAVEISQFVSEVFEELRGMALPINVDGVIGAITADMGLPPALAKGLFIFGRVAGLSAHYFEEVATQQPMRRINFSEVVYKGKELRKYPGCL